MDLQINLPHPPDAELVRRCVEHLHRETEGASVRPLGRYGYTDSRLYLVYCAPGDRGMPFVVKTDRRSVIKREADGVSRLRTYFPGALTAQIFPSPSEPEAIIYPLVSVDGTEFVVELSELVFLPPHAQQLGRPSSSELLTAAYESCKQAHAGPSRSIVFGEEYHRYLRESPERLLTDPLPELFQDSSTVEIYGQTLRDPRRILEAARRVELEVMTCAVHGDLHPNNVLFGLKFAPVLIDYAWGQLRGHFIKDYVLMECSLRFLLTPRLLQPNIMMQLDDALLDEEGYEAVASLDASGRTAQVLKETADLVSVIRTQCRQRHREYRFEEYLLAQYFVLMGAMRLLDYQEFRTLRYLCCLADRLESMEIL